MDYQKIRDKINDGKKIVEKYKDETPQPVLEVCYSMFDINELLVDKLEELDNKISKNSKNSSKPPSSDPNKTRKPRTKGRNPGGQKGRKGSTLRLSDNPDQIITHIPEGKCDCGRSLNKVSFTPRSRRQVFEIEMLKKVIEHQVFAGSCSCGKKHSGTFPDQAKSHVQYGSTTQALVSYLSKYHLIPFERLEEIMKDLFDLSLSEGTINNICNRGFEKLEGDFVPKVKTALEESKVNNADETPTRVNGERSHLHVLSNEAFTYLFSHKSRGMKAVDKIGILKKFQGTLIHDCFSMYFNYGKNHGICNSHLLRELTFVEEQYGHRWAIEAKSFLCDLNDIVIEKKSNAEVLDHILCEKIALDFKSLLDRGRQEVAPMIIKSKDRRRKAQPVPVKLCNRMNKLQDSILRFMWDFDVPFTNNLAERDLRMAKVHLKISGGFRSERGAQVYALFRSYIGTIKKHKLKVFKGLQDLFSHQNDTLSKVFIQSA